MSTSSFRWVCLPYCLQRQPDGRFVVLNRDYKPVGFKTTDHVVYGDYPIAMRIRGLTARSAKTLSCKGSGDINAIYLYNDGCIPTTSDEHMRNYLERLGRLAKYRVR